MSLTIKNRYLAGFYHFLISLFIFSIFVFTLLNFWYPAPYFTASGGWQGLKIVAAIDLIMGPALTLVIYNVNKPKKELYTDFSIIVFMQLAVLWWGITTVYSQRPIAAVFWDNGFYTVPASAIQDQGIDLAELDKFGSEKPLYIFAEQPQTEEDRDRMIDMVLKHQIPPHHQVSLYRPIESHYADIFKHNLNITEIITHNTDMKKEVDDVLKKTNSSLEENHYVSLKSKYRNIILIYSHNNQLIGTASAPFLEENDQ